MQATDREVISAERTLGLLWVMLLGLRYRAGSYGEFATIRELCERIEVGVPRCQEYNEAARTLVAQVRECCLGPMAPDRARTERLVAEVHRLERLLRESQ